MAVGSANLLKYKPSPVDAGTAIIRLDRRSFSRSQQFETFPSGALDRKVDRDRKNLPIWCTHTMTKRHDEQAAVHCHLSEISKSNNPIIIVQMLPNGAQDHEIEGQLLPRSGHFGKAIVKPRYQFVVNYRSGWDAATDE